MAATLVSRIQGGAGDDVISVAAQRALRTPNGHMPGHSQGAKSGNAVTDQMRAGILVYTTDGLYVDTLFTPPGGAPGYRKSFDFGSKTVYDAPGEYFGHGQTVVNPEDGTDA